jgi:hypothetical protein
MLSGNYEIVIVDEMLSYGFLCLEDVVAFQKPPMLHAILTGRNQGENYQNWRSSNRDKGGETPISAGNPRAKRH